MKQDSLIVKKAKKPVISVTLDDDIVKKLDILGANRSATINKILREVLK